MQYTYPTLLASCQNYCIDNSVEYVAEFPYILQLAEMRIIKDLNLSVFDVTTPSGVAVTANSPYVVKPNDLIAIQDFFIIVGGVRIYLQSRSKSYLDTYWPDYTQSDQPIYYAEDTETTWQLAPTPDISYNYQVNYIARPVPMSITNPTTYIGDHLGEVLLSATMVGSAAFFREDPATEQGMINLWNNTYTTAVTQAKMELDPLMGARDQVLSKAAEVS